MSIYSDFKTIKTIPNYVSYMSTLRETIENDPDVDLESVKDAVMNHYKNGNYTDTDEMKGAIANRIASQFKGWDKYSHLDSYTESELEDEIHSIAEEMATDIAA